MKVGALLWWAWCAAIALLYACSGVRVETGIAEPLRVRNATFQAGELPGEPPSPNAGTRPLVTSLETASTIVRRGQTEKSILGRTSPEAVAVGVRFADLGSGWWVLPVDAPDPATNGELGWQINADFGADIPPGFHPIRVVAIDASGHGGAQRDLLVCVAPSVPDNGNSCDAAKVPPAAIISLAWDVPVDLDLVVVTPDGRMVDAKHPRTVAPPPPGPSTGVDAGATDTGGAIDRDSNGACVIDGNNRESLVFQKLPPAGSYLVYASLFDACDHGPVHFRLSVFEPEVSEDKKTQRLVETITKSGTLLPVDAHGGARIGTFVTEISF